MLVGYWSNNIFKDSIASGYDHLVTALRKDIVNSGVNTEGSFDIEGGLS